MPCINKLYLSTAEISEIYAAYENEKSQTIPVTIKSLSFSEWMLCEWPKGIATGFVNGTVHFNDASSSHEIMHP